MKKIGDPCRHSPLRFSAQPDKTGIRDGWEIITEYQNEGEGPFLIDLSHIPKWDIQDAALSDITPLGMTIPEKPGQCQVQDGMLINRMNATQAVLWHLSKDKPLMPKGPSYTDVSDLYALMAVLGVDIFLMMERVTPLVLQPQATPTPCLIQGPVLHVPCHIVVMEYKMGDYALLIACFRGYGQAMADALLDAGKEWDLRPAFFSSLCIE